MASAKSSYVCRDTHATSSKQCDVECAARSAQAQEQQNFSSVRRICLLDLRFQITDIAVAVASSFLLQTSSPSVFKEEGKLADLMVKLVKLRLADHIVIRDGGISHLDVG